jgi:hypothetical protein
MDNSVQAGNTTRIMTSGYAQMTFTDPTEG